MGVAVMAVGGMPAEGTRSRCIVTDTLTTQATIRMAMTHTARCIRI